jgi:hypothetical protein
MKSSRDPGAAQSTTEEKIRAAVECRPSERFDTSLLFSPKAKLLQGGLA